MRRAALLISALFFAAPSAHSGADAVKAKSPSLKVQAIAFADIHPVGMQPGSERKFALSEWLGVDSVPATGVNVTWTVKTEGPVPRATIDQAGVLTVQKEASPGSILRISADLNHGERVISLPVFVYRPGLDPLLDVRDWHQTAEIPCDGSADRPVVGGIDELLFDVSGNYSVTWRPFESYKDYWGPYTINVKTRKVTFRVSRGNYVPKDIHGRGTFKVGRLGPPVRQADGTHTQSVQLRLNGIYLGTFGRPTRHMPCGMVFVGLNFQS